MLLPFSGIKPGFLVAGGGVLILILAMIFFYRAHNQELIVNGAIKTENGILKQKEDFTEKSMAITDLVVDNFVQEVKKSNVTTDKLRHESINGYINKIEPVVEPTTTPKGALPDGAARVSMLANSMHENYCRARPKDVQCNTLDTVK